MLHRDQGERREQRRTEERQAEGVGGSALELIVDPGLERPQSRTVIGIGIGFERRKRRSQFGKLPVGGADPGGDARGDVDLRLRGKRGVEQQRRTRVPAGVVLGTDLQAQDRSQQEDPGDDPGVPSRQCLGRSGAVRIPPSKRCGGENGEGQCEAAADQDLGGHGQVGRRSRQEPERCESSGDRDRPGDGQGARRVRTQRDPACDQRRQRHQADDGRCLDWRKTPALGEQHNEQEQGACEARREQAKRDLGPAVGLAPSTSFGDAVGPARREEQGDQRHLKEKDRLPAEKLSQDAAQRGPDSEADGPRGAPQLGGGTVRAPVTGEQLDRAGQRGGAAHSLRASRRDQQSHIRGQRAGEGRGREDEQAAAPEPLWPDSRQACSGDDQNGQHHVVGGQHPADAEDAGVVLAEDLGQCQGYDRGVGQHDADAQRPDKSSRTAGAHRSTCNAILPRRRGRRALNRSAGIVPATVRTRAYASTIGSS